MNSYTNHPIQYRSHSWFGNLVTNATWSEFYLNEVRPLVYWLYNPGHLMDDLSGS